MTFSYADISQGRDNDLPMRLSTTTVRGAVYLTISQKVGLCLHGMG